jgi:zinc D-Ala-D-Ala carboxypeptidase
MTPLDYALSKNFTWAEMTRTGQTALQEQNREEAEKYKDALEALCRTIMQPIRDKFGPLRVNSGFRGAAVNAAVGSKPTSQHRLGQACDFVPQTNASIEQIVHWIAKESKLPFGQVINEKPSVSSQWIHVSLGEPWRKTNNRQALFFNGRTYTPIR